MDNEKTHDGSHGHQSFYDRIRHNHVFQKLLRLIQFLSATISLGLFSARLARILRTVRRATASNGAVEGILAAAVAYTLTTMLLKFVLKKNGPKWLRWLMILLDIGFVGGFIAVAVLTSPGRNTSSGPCHYVYGRRIEPNGANCNLPWGTFILAIVSTLLHALTAIFNEVRDSRRRHKDARLDSA